MRGSVTVVYYDVGVVTAEHVAAAERSAGGGVLDHVLSGDAVWDAGGSTHRTVPGRRSADARRHLGRHIDELAHFTRGRRRWQRSTRWRATDLLEVARSEWFAGLAEPVHRVFVVERLLADGPTRLLWVTADPALATPSFRSALSRLAAAHEAEAEVVVVATDGPRPGDTTGAGGNGWRRRLRRELGSLRNDLRGGSTCPKPCEVASRVIFVEGFVSHLPAPVAVAEELGRREGAQVLFVAANRAVLDKLPSSVDPHPLLTLATVRVRLGRHVPMRAIERTARQVSRTVAAGGGPAGLLGALLEPGLEQATTRSWRSAADVTPLAHHVVRRFRPSAVVTSTKAPPASRAIITASRRHGAESWFVQHALLFTAAEGDGSPMYDRFLVWGDRDRRGLVERGVPSERVHVTGSPKFARMRERARTADERHDEGFTVAYLPSNSDGRIVSMTNAKAMLRTVLDGIRTLEHARLVIKVHPGDRTDIFDGVGAQGAVEVLRGGDAIDVMLGASVVVAASSTAGLEACALGLPLVVLSLPGVEVPDEYERYGAAVMVSDATQLAESLRDLRANGELMSRLAAGRNALIEDVFAGMVPGAAVCCADAIVPVARRGS